MYRMDPTTENHLLQLARTGRLRFPKPFTGLYPFLAILYALIAPLVTSALVSIPLAIILYLSGSYPTSLESLLGSGAGLTVLLVVSFSPIFILVWLWLWIFERRSLRTVGLEAPGWIAKYLRGAFWGLVLISAAILLPAVAGFYRLEGANLALGAALASTLLLLVGWIVQGAAEELLFRGFLLQIIGVRFGLLFGILISSILFAILHIFNQNINALAILNLILFGVFAALYALGDGSLWGVFAVHSAWNWAQGNVFGMDVSGLPIRLQAVIQLKEAGPDWLTGGAFGPEGGVGVTLVLVAGIIVVLLFRRSARQAE